jgi:predicted DNA-binding transcriptional regulator AlpA
VTRKLPSDLLKKAEVARILDLSKRTIERWVSLGKFPPPIEISKYVKRWSCAQIEAIARGEKWSPPAPAEAG